MELHECEPCISAQLILNGAPRISNRSGKYFSIVQPYQHHTSVPSVPIHIYSFSIQPEEIQPTGACNMSAVEDAVLKVLTLGEEMRVFAVNYNILRVTGGMAGLVFEN